MKTHSIQLAATAVIFCSFNMDSSATEFCDPSPPNSTSCPLPTVVTHSKTCPKDIGHQCTDPNAVPVAEIDCVVSGSSAWCEAWAQGGTGTYSYVWTTSGALGAPQSTGAVSVARCNGHIGGYKVRVIASNGNYSEASMPVNCADN